ncbi:hypothetical protein JTB14_003389 [Gonioctena quinquepunctata]|nr:hypothetical protein JTB14_003389 [Gonioctena quinquepunctata]
MTATLPERLLAFVLVIFRRGLIRLQKGRKTYFVPMLQQKPSTFWDDDSQGLLMFEDDSGSLDVPGRVLSGSLDVPGRGHSGYIDVPVWEFPGSFDFPGRGLSESFQHFQFLLQFHCEHEVEGL